MRKLKEQKGLKKLHGDSKITKNKAHLHKQTKPSKTSLKQFYSSFTIKLFYKLTFLLLEENK